MPFAGIGLHVLVALFFAIHAARNGQPWYWLIVLFSFPLLGSAVYFVVVYLPNSKLHRPARNAMAATAKVLDPKRELREAQAACEYTPTAQNQMRLAAAQLHAGLASEAATNFETCLRGPLASDPDIRWGAACAYLHCGQGEKALGHLQFLINRHPQFRAESVAVARAQAFALTGHAQEAQTTFEDALTRFGSFEVCAEYAIWSATSGQHAIAVRLLPELQQAMSRWNAHTKRMHQALLRRLNAALGQANLRL